MIEFTKSYKTSDGEVFGTIEEAQQHDLELVFKKLHTNLPVAADKASDFALAVVTAKDEIIDILTTTPNSKPKARSSHGGTKNRKKTVITDAATTVVTTLNQAPNND